MRSDRKECYRRVPTTSLEATEQPHHADQNDQRGDRGIAV